MRFRGTPPVTPVRGGRPPLNSPKAGVAGNLPAVGKDARPTSHSPTCLAVDGNRPRVGETPERRNLSRRRGSLL